MITYKWLDGDDLDRLEPILAQKKWASLNKQTCRAYAAFDGESMAGFIVMQLVPHTEPLYVYPEYRGSGIAEELASGMSDFMERVESRCFMVVADTPEAQKICESNNMKRIESPVYIKIGG